MSKKYVVLLVFVLFALSVMAISTIGNLPEYSIDKVPLTSVQILRWDSALEDDDGGVVDKIIYVDQIIKKVGDSIDIEFQINPEEGATYRLKINVDQKGVFAEVDSVFTNTIHIVYSDESLITNMVTIEITISDAETEGIEDKVFLLFEREGSVIDPDPDAM
jgi:hypothetical protein